MKRFFEIFEELKSKYPHAPSQILWEITVGIQRNEIEAERNEIFKKDKITVINHPSIQDL